MQRFLRIVLFALAAGLVTSVAFSVAFFGSAAMVRGAPASPWLALLLVAAIPLLARLGDWALGGRGFLAAALTVTLVAPLIALGALHELSEPLIHENPPMCGTPRVTLEMSIPPLMFAWGAASALIAALLAHRIGARLGRAVRLLAMASAAIAGVLALGSMVRAARRPVTDDYVASLPIVARVRAASGTPERITMDLSRRRPSVPGTEEIARGPRDLHEDEVDGLLLRRTCGGGQCRVDLLRKGTPKDQASFDRGEVSDDQVLVVRRDPARPLWTVDAFGTRAYVGPELTWRSVYVRDVASSLSPPRGWIAGALGGLAIAGAAFAARRRASRRRRSIAEGRAGTLTESGLVTFGDDEPPLRAATDQALAVGPVVVLEGPLAPGGVYRGDAAAIGARVACGERGELLGRADAVIGDLDALALAALALGSAPLWAAAFVGVVL